MSPAQELWAAAAGMRELAEAAPPGTWYATTGPEDTAHVWGKTASIIPEHVAQIDSDEAERDLATARHMAAWHPAVALAIAALLDAIAANWATIGDDFSVPLPLTVARAFMGEGQA